MKSKLEKLSFILGLFASDGNLDVSRVRFFCSNEEIEFFTITVKPIVDEVFSTKTTLRRHDYSTYVLSINSAEVANTFKKLFNVEGKKGKTVGPPKCKFDKALFVAGLLSGDGSIVISKNKGYKNKYPILFYVSASKNLIEFISRYFNNSKISHYVHQRKDGNYQLVVKGSNLNNLFNYVPLLNPIQTSKLQILERFGSLEPYTTYQQRLNILNAPVV